MSLKMSNLCLIAMVGLLAHVALCEPNYQPQQQPGGNDFSGAGGGGVLPSQQQQPWPYPPAGAPARYRPAAPATTPAPTFFQRISNWFSFLGDDSDERRPQLQQQQQQQQQLQQQQQQPQLPPQRKLPPLQYTAQPTPSVQTQQQLQFQQQQYQQQQLQLQQQQPLYPPLQQQPIQQQFPYPFQIRNGSRATQLAPQQQQFQSPQVGFQPSAPVQQQSGSSYHAAVAPQNAFVPSTLQQQIVPQVQNVFRDPEPTTGRTPPVSGPEPPYHPCNNVPWVPIAAPPEYPSAGGTGVGTGPGSGVASPQIPPTAGSPSRPPPIKIQVAHKGQVQSVNPYTGPSGSGVGLEPAIITAAPHAQQLIQLQLQQQQHQLQNLQLQQLQLQQQQLQQQLQQLKTTTTTTTGAPPAPVAAHFITKHPDALVTAGPSTTLQPITLRQVSASYFTNKEYAPPAKLLPIQNEGKPLAPIPLPNLSATPIPPLYTAGSFHSDPYKFYRPYRPVEPLLELGHGYPTSGKSKSNSYIRYPHDPREPAKNESIFEVEQFATSASSARYTTVAYSNGEDSRPEASEKRNVATSSNGNSGASVPHQTHGEDTEYDSDEEDTDGRPDVRTTVEVSSVVPQTRYYGSSTTVSFASVTSPRPDRHVSGYSTLAPSDLGNGVQLIYSANLQTAAPIDPVNNRLIDSTEQQDSTERTTVRSQSPVPMTTTTTSATPVDESSPTDIYSEPFRIGSSLPMEFQKQSTPEPDSQMVELTTPGGDTTPRSTTPPTPQPSSLTATFGGYQNLLSTKKPKQIQIIIPYNTYKKPEPFRPLPGSVYHHLDLDLDYNAPEESSIVTSKHSDKPTGTTHIPSGNAIDSEQAKPKTRFVENDSVKYVHSSTTQLREILQKETTQPFAKPPTRTPPKPAKVKKVRPVEISKESKPFTVRVPKMTPLPPVVSVHSLTSVRGGMERITTTPLPDLEQSSGGGLRFGPTPPGALLKYAKPVTPHYVNVSRVKISPTTYAQKSRTTISQLLRTTKIIPKGPKLFSNDLLGSETSRTVRPPLSPASASYQHHRRTAFLSSSTTTSTTPRATSRAPTSTTEEQQNNDRFEDERTGASENTLGPIYERTIEWDIDPNELQRKIDTWTEQEFGSEDFALKASTLSLHRVTKAIPWEFLTSTMLPALHDKPGKTSRSGWHHVKIAISPITKEKIYVVTPQPWTAALLNNHHHHHHHHHHNQHHNHHAEHRVQHRSQQLEDREGRAQSPRFSVRPTPLYYKGGGIYQTGSSTVDVSPESVNDLLEQKPQHRFSIGSSGPTPGSGPKVKHLLQQRKYVRKKLPFGGPGTGRPLTSREDV